MSSGRSFDLKSPAANRLRRVGQHHARRRYNRAVDRPSAHHYHPLVRSVARALRQRCSVGTGTTIIVACSGGADSVALLRALAMLAKAMEEDEALAGSLAQVKAYRDQYGIQ